MKTDNIVILKNLNADFEDWQYYVTSANNIEDGLLHNTYSQYGQQIDEYEAGDYCLANTESGMKDEIKKELIAKFNIKQDAELHIDVECDLYDNNLEWEIVDDEDLISEMKEVIEQYNTYIEGTNKSEKINGWIIGNSRWQNDPWMCYLMRE